MSSFPRIDPNALDFVQRVLHAGLDGDVQVAKLKSNEEAMLVAVKRFAIRNSTSVSRFDKESTFLELKELRNICRPLGIVRSAPHYWLVFPLFPLGDLAQVSRSHGEANLLSNELKLMLAVDFCDALLSVNELGYVFRDFKSANVLVGADYHAKLTDFGSVQSVALGIVRDGGKEMGPSGGFHKRLMEGTTLLYAAPEVITLQSRNELHLESDVYSLGVTMCELAMGEPPFHGIMKDIPAMNTVMDATYNEQSLLSAICTLNIRPLLALESKAWMELIAACWEGEYVKRPKCSEVLQRLKQILWDEFNLDYNAMATVQGNRNEFLRHKPALAEGDDDSVKRSKMEEERRHAGDSIPAAPTRLAGALLQDDFPPISIGSFATSGRRGADKMEDRHSVLRQVLRDGETELTVILVLDGHGGQGAAEFCNQELALRIQNLLFDQPAFSDVNALVAQAFLETDQRFLALHPNDTSGTTALALLIWTRRGAVLRALVANCGDCRLIVGEKRANRYHAVRVTNDHNADQPAERARIEKLGGRVVVDSNGNGRVEGHIKVTRALGDASMKRFVRPEPEITPVELSSGGGGGKDFLIVGTDGLFDNMEDQDVIQSVLDTAKQVGLSAKRLGSEAIARGVTDNVTSVVVFLREWDESGKKDWDN